MSHLCILIRCPPFFSFSSRLKEFKSSLFTVFQSAHAQSVKMTVLMDGINKEREKQFTEPEVRAALARMQDDNQVMVADDIIFLIWGSWSDYDSYTHTKKTIAWTCKEAADYTENIVASPQLGLFPHLTFALVWRLFFLLIHVLVCWILVIIRLCFRVSFINLVTTVKNECNDHKRADATLQIKFEAVKRFLLHREHDDVVLPVLYIVNKFRKGWV